MIEELKADAAERMEKSVDSLVQALRRIRTGRANPALLDGIEVEYYGVMTPLRQVANVNVEDGRTLAIQPYERKLVPLIEKAILKSDIGVTPNAAGETIRVPMPPLTEQTRKELMRSARSEAENGRVAVRNIRRDVIADIRELLREKEITEDEERRALDDIQQITDRFTSRIDKVLEEKEADLLEI